MRPAFDQTSIRKVLLKAVQSGWFTVEMLDTPSAGFVANTAVDRETFPGGYEGVQFRNLLRDMDAPMEAVQALPDPKDFDAVLPPADPPPQDQKLPLTLEQPEKLPWE